MSDDGTRIVAGSKDRTATVWNVKDGTLVSEVRVSNRISSVALAPNKEIFAVGDWDGRVTIFGARSGEEIRRFTRKRGAIRSLKFLPDGHTVAVGDSELSIWDVDTATLLRTFATIRGAVQAVDVSLNGQLVVAAIDDTQADIVKKEDEDYLEVESRTSPIQVFEVATGKLVETLKGHQLGSTSLAFARSDRYFVSGSRDRTAKVWDLQTVRARLTLKTAMTTVTSLRTTASEALLIFGDASGAVERLLLLSGRVDTLLRVNAGYVAAVATAGATTALAAGINLDPSLVFVLEHGSLPWSLPVTRGAITSLAMDGSGQRILVGGEESEALLLDVSTHAVHALSGFCDRVTAVAFSGDARYGFTGEGEKDAFRFRDDGKLVIAACRSYPVRKFDLQSMRQVGQLTGHRGFITGLRSLANGNRVISSSNDGTARLWDVEGSLQLHAFVGHTKSVGALDISENESLLLTGSVDRSVRLWSIETGQESCSLLGHGAEVSAVVFLPGETRAASAAKDGATKIWDLKSCSEMLSIALLGDGEGWVVTEPGGRFDVAGFERDEGIAWVLPDDPFHALPLEIFMRDYFEPRLLQRVLAGEKFVDLPALDKLNRVQPPVAVVSVEPEKSSRDAGGTEPETVQVTVEVAGDSREFGLEGNKRRVSTGVYDLRLFRDGQLVEQWPVEPTATGTQQSDHEKELAEWRKDHRVVGYVEGANTPKRIVFKGIRLPRLAGKDKVEFSAYAFNVDRVKSETAKWSYELPKGLKPRVPRAYIVTIGVNAFEDEAWDLKYAANDARQSGSELKKRLEAVLAPDGSKQYDKVVWVPLISDATKEPGKLRRITVAQANKKQIEAVLKTLAGQTVDPQALSGIESAKDLRRVDPEDLVIIVMSTHGMVDDRGTFYFLPADIGREFSRSSAPDPATKAKMLAQAVSNDELAQWLRGLDAVDQVMIIDACHSAASVQSAEFKPGPMGSRGLGQLAYDKGMRILAATQKDQDAIDGTDKTKMGLLIYALIEDGLRAGKADNAPKDGRIMLSEWLNYASQRVPGVFQGIKDGTIKGTRGTVEYSSDPKTDAARRASLQQPSLFDFAKGRDLPLDIEASRR